MVAEPESMISQHEDGQLFVPLASDRISEVGWMLAVTTESNGGLLRER